MRFDDVIKFKIEELELDEGNYRFRGADDQRKCIEKIYSANPKNFNEIIKSVAENDLGEVLLIYKDNKRNIVMDGNRRIAALKVLHNNNLSPSESIRRLAKDLIKKYKVSFVGIQAQISTNKSLILKTVFERHSAGGGVSRLDWPALGKARFGYDHEGLGEKMPISEQRLISLLYMLEQLRPKLTEYFESKKYKHEVFRRIFPIALEKNIIDNSIYYKNKAEIKKRISKSRLTRTLKICKKIFKDISNGVVGLSRKKGKYADSEGVKEYLSKFDNKSSSRNSSGTGGSSGKSTEGGTGGAAKTNYGFPKSQDIENAISKTGYTKYEQLYNSICTISLDRHPTLLLIGVWAFIESIATDLGKDIGIPIESFFSHNWINNNYPGEFNKQEIKEIRDYLEDIRKQANSSKHDGEWYLHTAKNFVPSLKKLEPLLIKSLEKIAENKLSNS